MPDYLEYQKSVAAEFKALEKRVRNLIDDSHWGEEGRYKEAILINYLKRVLPKHLSVGTGFVRNNGEITNQIDVIIYENSYPLFFTEGDFIVSPAQNVVGIIEVKSGIKACDLCEIVHKANENARIIVGNTSRSLFNGVFAYNADARPNTYVKVMNEDDFSYISSKLHFNQIISDRLYSCVNHIALGDRLLLKLWPVGQGDEKQEKSSTGIPKSYYSLYQMDEGLAFSYFFSSLQEFLIKIVTNGSINHISNDMIKFFYPLEKGKESNLVSRIFIDK